jgi:serine/threonine protein kinase
MKIVKDYTFHELVGKGQYGSVYRVTLINDPNKELAVKAYSLKTIHENKEIKQLIENEIRIF